MTHDSSAGRVAVTATVTGETLRRPPLVELRVTLIADNQAAAPRWVLVPRDLGGQLTTGGVDTLEVHRWTGAGAAVDLGWFMGNAGFWALRVGAGVRVELRDVPVRYWAEDGAARPPLEVIVAESVDVGGKPAEAWFPTDPTAKTAATLDHGPVVSSAKLAGGPEVPVAAKELDRVHASSATPAPAP